MIKARTIKLKIIKNEKKKQNIYASQNNKSSNNKINNDNQ